MTLLGLLVFVALMIILAMAFMKYGGEWKHVLAGCCLALAVVACVYFSFPDLLGRIR